MVATVRKLLQYSNKLKKVVSILACVMAAQSSGERRAIEMTPSLKHIRLARQMLFIVESYDIGNEVEKKMTTLTPRFEGGMWVTKGRLGKGLPKILGVEKLPILLSSSRLSELIMIEAHLENHDGAPGTLARSRTRAWIHKGRYLARKVASRCVHCRAAAARIQEQRMGPLPEERCQLGAKPFLAICLDLLGPVVVKAMASKRANMKVWPILFVCQ